MESRMRGNSHVRFGAGDEETCLGDGARRFIPTLLESLRGSPSLEPPLSENPQRPFWVDRSVPILCSMSSR